MNSTVSINQQKKLPLWLLILLTVILLISLTLLSGLIYKKWIAEPVQQRNKSELIIQQELLLAQDGVINTNWLHTLNPLVKNVTGRVVWSNILQKGVMEFVGLPKIDKDQKYQLWIYDLVGKDTKPILSNEFTEITSTTMLLPFTSKELILSPFKFELVLKTEGDEVSQPLFLAQP